MCLSRTLIDPSICVCSSFYFGFEGWIWDLIVLIPDHSFCINLYSRIISLACFGKSKMMNRLFYAVINERKNDEYNQCNTATPIII